MWGVISSSGGGGGVGTQCDKIEELVDGMCHFVVLPVLRQNWPVCSQ